MKHLPNILSVSRILFSFLLIFLINTQVWFIFCYLVCGVSDVADGYLARRFNATSKLGSFLDSLSDLVFWVIILYLAITFIQFQTYMIVVMILVCCIRIINIIYTKYKFNSWSIMHTILNKLTGILVYFFLPVCFVVGYVPIWIAVFIFTIAIISAIEEFVICLLTSNYNENTKSIFHI
jgi:phosphatidylglycerophosphate synthase